MPRWYVVNGSLIPAELTGPRTFDFTSITPDDITRAMRSDERNNETRRLLAQNKQDARKLLRQSVRAQTKRIQRGAWG